jgi:O-antigen/teichoic acid export membrane protein
MTISDGEPDFEDGSHSGQFGRAGRRVTASVLSGYGSTLLISGLGALATRLITVHTGPTNYGLFVTALTFVSSVMLLTDLGITSIMGRDIAKTPDGAAEILGQNLGLRLTLSVVIIPVVVFVGLLLYKAPSLRWTLILFAVSIPFNAVQTISLGYYVASIRNYVASGIAFLQQIIFVGGVAIAIQGRRVSEQSKSSISYTSKLTLSCSARWPSLELSGCTASRTALSALSSLPRL